MESASTMRPAGKARWVRAAIAKLARRRDLVLGPLVFALTLLVFRTAPVEQQLDSRFSILLSQNLLLHHDFALERYDLPEDYRLISVAGHRYYYFPPGSSILSAPLVRILNLAGLSAVDRSGHYDERGELAIDSDLASALMAAFSVLAYFMARSVLPVGWSLGIAALSAFGTQVFSTMSRAMWSDTWGVLLVTGAALLLLRARARATEPPLVAIASLEALAYVVRPTNALVLVFTAFYVAAVRPRRLHRFLLPAAAWLAIFCAWSWRYYHRLLPPYYAADRLDAPSSTALLGNLISPSRGLLVYVPFFVAVVLVLAVRRRSVRFPLLVALSGCIVTAHLLVLSRFGHWWGGHCYGARLTASLVPWVTLLAVLAADALRSEQPAKLPSMGAIALVPVLAVLCIASVAINAVGAYSIKAARWNGMPTNIDDDPERRWVWREAQFLSPFVEPPPVYLPLPAEGLAMGTADADPYLAGAWWDGETDFRWTQGGGAAIVHFMLPMPTSAAILELTLRPYVPKGKLSTQRLTVSINDHPVGSLDVRDPAFTTYRFIVPAGLLKAESTVRLRTPDAISPRDAEDSVDGRALGVAVQSLRWRSAS